MSVLDALARELGPASLSAAPASAPGLEGCVRPGSGEQLAAALRLLSEAGAPAVVRGGGSWDALGHPMPRARIRLETTGLLADALVDSDDGVAHVPAGALVSDLSERVRKESGGAWELPMDPASPRATLGGCLATAAPGLGFGHPRDVVLGLETVLASGERVRCGGRVVKNVTGYDLAKLYLGSLGSLAVIEGAWLRLLPAPESTVHWWVPAPDAGAAVLPARLASVRTAAWVSDGLAGTLGADAPGLWLELAGDAPSVEADADRLVAHHGARPADAGGLARLHALRGREGGLRIRLAVLPSALGQAGAALEAAGAELLALPARGLLWALAEDAAVLDVVAQLGSGYLVEAAPLEVRESRELFGEDPALRPLQAALKAQYDPQGVLNPGRFAGRI